MEKKPLEATRWGKKNKWFKHKAMRKAWNNMNVGGNY